MLSFLLLLVFSYFPCTLEDRAFHFFQKLNLPSVGSEAYAFDPKGQGPYTGLNDGRIVKYQGPKFGFTDFAITVANRYVHLDSSNHASLFLSLFLSNSSKLTKYIDVDIPLFINDTYYDIDTDT